MVCGCSILVSRYVGVSYWSTEIWVSYGVARHYDLRWWMPRVLLPRVGVVGDGNDTTRALMTMILLVYMWGVQPVTTLVRLTSCVWFMWWGLWQNGIDPSVCVWYLVFGGVQYLLLFLDDSRYRHVGQASDTLYSGVYKHPLAPLNLAYYLGAPS